MGKNLTKNRKRTEVRTDENEEIEKILGPIKTAVDVAQQEIKKPPMKSVTIVLKWLAKVDGGISFKIPFLTDGSGGWTGTKSHTNETTIVFEPKPKRGIMKEPISDEVRKIADMIKTAATILPGLDVTKAKVQIEFTLSQEGGINLILVAKEATAKTNTMTIEFGEMDDEGAGKKP